MRRSWCFAVVLAATAGLVAGCGGSDGAGTPSSSPTPPESSIPSSAPAPASTSASVETSATSASTSAETSTSSVGAQPAGSAIKVGASSRLPTKVGEWTLNKGSSGTASIYSNDGVLIGVSFLAASDYDAIVKNITQKKTRAGTGCCGSTSVPTNLTCYLKTGDGVLNVSADGGELPLPQLVAFTNLLTATLGTR